MTLEASTQVNIKILEKEYQISCPVSERVALLNSAELLNAKMREIRDSGKVIGLDRIAVMAALNMANELLRSRNIGESLEGNAKLRLQAMRERIEGALQAGRQLDL
ncbi:MAG: cell division protein ZapA [Gammaproteobacteria bacterium]|nr:cell division protein ZapA [Gammaproteobacteria bacterium]MCP5140050.1 cell division protein ZapA [Chromatiales bacterium]